MRNTRLELVSNVSHLYAACLKLIPNPLNSSKNVSFHARSGHEP